MSRYVITITPDNGGAPSADTAHTTVRIDTSTGQTRITELTVRAASGGGLAPADLPPVDLDLLVRALTAPAPAQALPPSDEPVAAAEPAPGPAVEEEPAAVAVEEPAVTTPRRARKAGAAKKAAAKKTAGRKATTAKKATKKAAAPRRRAAAEAAPTTSGTRAYRRMPEADQVMAVYQQTGSITGVAEHFDVPRHTVAGWARRLRSMGHAIGRQ